MLRLTSFRFPVLFFHSFYCTWLFSLSELHIALTFHKSLKIIGNFGLLGELHEEICMRLTVDIISCCCSIRSSLIRIVKTVIKTLLSLKVFSKEQRMGMGMRYLPIALFSVNLREVLDDMT